MHFIENNNGNKKKSATEKKRLRQRKHNNNKTNVTVLQFTSCNMSFVRLRLVLHITENRRKLKNCIKKCSPSANKLVADIKVLEKWAVKLVCGVTLDFWVIWLLRFARFFHDLAQKVLPEKKKKNNNASIKRTWISINLFMRMKCRLSLFYWVGRNVDCGKKRLRRWGMNVS